MRGQWITCPGCDAPWVVGSFHALRPETGTVEISGLGFFELYLNGRRVTDELLTPVWSDYSTRDGSLFRYPLRDVMHHRVYRCVWEIGEYLREGENEIRILLGNGFYSQHERLAEGKMAYGEAPVLWFELHWQDEKGEHLLPSDETLLWHPSQIIRNNVYTGETQDLRKEDSLLRPVLVIDGPDGEMTVQRCPSDAVQKIIKPRLLHSRGSMRIYDAGENLTGWAALDSVGARDEEIVVRYAERLSADGMLDFASCGKNQVQEDRYICSGERLSVHPHFTWHGFRYFSVEGGAENIWVQKVHAHVPVTGRFHCSDDVLNWLTEAYLRTRLNNMHCGVPSDCPHRERLGYTGDGQAVIMTDLYFLDGQAFFEKWMQDILDGQDLQSGHVQHTALFYGGGGGPGGWGGAIVLVPWAYYLRYGDRELLGRQYPAMLKWVDYMFSRMDQSGAVVCEEEGGWCLGDWCAPEPMTLPEPFVNTCLLARCLGILIRMGRILSRDTGRLVTLLEQVQHTVRRLWWDGTHYALGKQGADALALEAGLGGAPLAAALNAHYSAQPWFDTGFLATGSVIRMLFAYGYGDTAVALLTGEKEGHSFGWQRMQGADTLWERWDGSESRNHPMFGSVIGAMMEGMMGISLEDSLTLRPFFPKALSHASCAVETKEGRVALSWERKGSKIILRTHLPAPGWLLVDGQEIRLDAGETSVRLQGGNTNGA